MKPVERYRLALELLGKSEGKRILDVGCSIGRLEGFVNAIGIDSNPAWIKQARELNPSASFFVASAENLPFENNYFDFVVFLDSLEHVESKEKALSEANRVLKKNCSVILSVPSNRLLPKILDLEYWLFPFFGRKKHAHFSRKEISVLLENQGFVLSHCFERAGFFSAVSRWILFPFDLLDFFLLGKVSGFFGLFARFFIDPLIDIDFSKKRKKGAFLFAVAKKQ